MGAKGGGCQQDERELRKRDKMGANKGIKRGQRTLKKDRNELQKGGKEIAKGGNKWGAKY